jgi:hypothetical protein
VNLERLFTNADFFFDDDEPLQRKKKIQIKFRATFYMNDSLLEVDFPIVDTFYVVVLQLTIFNFMLFVIASIFIYLPALNSEIGSTLP